jgi:hypothetical protein
VGLPSLPTEWLRVPPAPLFSGFWLFVGLGVKPDT